MHIPRQCHNHNASYIQFKQNEIIFMAFNHKKCLNWYDCEFNVQGDMYQKIMASYIKKCCEMTLNINFNVNETLTNLC